MVKWRIQGILEDGINFCPRQPWVSTQENFPIKPPSFTIKDRFIEAIFIANILKQSATWHSQPPAYLYNTTEMVCDGASKVNRRLHFQGLKGGLDMFICHLFQLGLYQRVYGVHK